MMKVSARNQLRGSVSSIKEGSVHAQVTIDVGGQMVTSVVTMDSIKELGLAEGSAVVALVKSDSVMLAVE